MNETIQTIIINFPTFAGLVITIIVMRQWIAQMVADQAEMSERIATLEKRLDDCLASK